jgi:hypothetical protein
MDKVILLRFLPRQGIPLRAGDLPWALRAVEVALGSAGGPEGVVIAPEGVPPWLLAGAVHLLHPRLWVAVMEDRETAVVAVSHCREVSVGGQIRVAGEGIRVVEVPVPPARVLALSGPPKAGKSRLRGALYEALRALEVRARKAGAAPPRWFVQAFSPDSEGQWVADAHALGRGAEAEARARAIKNALKGSGAFFSPEWVEKTRSQLHGLCRWAEVVVADLGGLPSSENREILEGAREAQALLVPVVLTRPDGEDGGWGRFWAGMGLRPLYAGPFHEGLAAELLRGIIPGELHAFLGGA